MWQLKRCSKAFVILVILFLESCLTAEVRSTPNLAHIRNNKSVALNVSINECVTKYPLLKSTGKTWQVGRVSRKHYEIINMLWRKTNVFADEGDSFSSPFFPHSRQLSKQTKNLVELLTTVPQKYLQAENTEVAPTRQTISYIEFYYLDENLQSTEATPELNSKDRKRETKVKEKSAERLGQFKNFMPRSPLLSFRSNNKPVPKYTYSGPQFNIVNNEVQTKVPHIELQETRKENILQSFLAKNNAPRYVMPSPYTTTESTLNMKETPNDRVKFFELYDSYTRTPTNTNKTHSFIDNAIDREERIMVEQVDKDIEYEDSNKARFSVKHIKEEDKIQNSTPLINKIKSKAHESTKSVMTIINSTHQPSTSTPTWDEFFNYTSSEYSETNLWPKYPFAAVYVYERLQVHCDAASISAYWLVASAACLSRHREDPNGEDRSAFVAYCGDTWWSPERIAYVKYTLVHPRYNPKDTVRRHLYNIGVIQVASSMSSSCPYWAPVSIMSHQYVTNRRGSFGSALGWGLDRYDTSYSSRDLPRHFLSVYNGELFSESCPGNSGYISTKHVSEEATSNVYCLSLPPYVGEDNDPVHGSLLLVEGKLIALYLQEERRRWGDQSAQYTGVWRLIPWVLEVAKDPDDMEFTFLR